VRVRPTTPNKQGYTMTRALWRFDTLPLDEVVWCAGARYDLTHDAKGVPFYLYHALPALRALILDDGQHLFL